MNINDALELLNISILGLRYTGTGINISILGLRYTGTGININILGLRYTGTGIMHISSNCTLYVVSRNSSKKLYVLRYLLNYSKLYDETSILKKYIWIRVETF